MQPNPLILALSLGLLAAACSEPECPKDSIRISADRCKSCQPGSHPEDNVCVPDDGNDDGGTAPDSSDELAMPSMRPTEQADGGTPIPRAENVPTLGGFATVGEPRKNSASNTLSEDGFETGATLCHADGRCLTGSFAP